MATCLLITWSISHGSSNEKKRDTRKVAAVAAIHTKKLNGIGKIFTAICE